MSKTGRYSITKTAAEMQEKDRFYISGKKYCVTNKPLRDAFGRVLITFIHVNGSPIQFNDLHVAEDFSFMVLTGESGIGENAYNELQMLRENNKERPYEIQKVNPRPKEVLDIVLPTRAIAEEVMDRMFEFLVKYDVVSVGDLYELVGLAGTFEDTKWGWSDIAGSSIALVTDGHKNTAYQLVLPKPVEIVSNH